MNRRTTQAGFPTVRLAALMFALGVAAFMSGIANVPPIAADHDDRPGPKLYLDCPRTHVEEGGSLKVYLVRTDLNGHEQDNFAVFWHTEPKSAQQSDYARLDGVWQHSTEAERRANRMELTIRTHEDNRLEGEETFGLRFAPRTLAKDLDDPRRDNRCDITSVDDEARVTGIEIISRPGGGDTYGRKETIEFAVTFSREVEVEGRPIMGVWVNPGWKAARYDRGSGTDTLVFAYTVGERDRDGNGVSVTNGYHDGRRWHGFGLSSVIKVKDTDIGVSRMYGGIGNQSRHRADGSIRRDAVGIRIISTPADGIAYDAGEDIEIEIRYQEAVRVTGRKGIAIRVGDYGSGRPTYRAARYVRGSGTDRIVYAYTVRSGERDDTGISVDRGSRGSGYTRDGRLNFQPSGTEVSVYYPPLDSGLDHKVYARDRIAPTLSSVTLASDPGDDETYAVGDSVEVAVTFDENMAITGSPRIELDIGGAARYAEYDRVAGDVVVFAYTIAEGDADPDGISIAANKLSRHGGTIADLSGNPAGITHDAVPADTGHLVDGISPKFGSAITVTIPADPGFPPFVPPTPARQGIAVTLSEPTDPFRTAKWLSAHLELDVHHFFEDIVDVTVDGVPAKATGLIMTRNTLTIPLQHVITADQDVKVSYDNNFARDSQGFFADSAGNPVKLFSNQPVTNASTATETTADSDADGIVLSVAEVNIAEGGAATYSVSLATQPDSDVTVSLSVDPSGGRVTASVPSLTFTSDNWITTQDATLTATEDTATSKYWAMVNHAATGGGYDGESGSVRVVVVDND